MKYLIVQKYTGDFLFKVEFYDKRVCEEFMKMIRKKLKNQVDIICFDDVSFDRKVVDF